MFGTSWIRRKLISVHRRFDKSNHKRRLGGRTDDGNGLFFHHHLAAEDRQILLGVILFMVSYAVYAERRVSAFIQDRLGPNRVGPAGLFQPIADMFKLLLKEDFTPRAT